MQRENFMESLHSDGSATYLLIIWVEKNYTFRNEIETKTISLNCFSKYKLLAGLNRFDTHSFCNISKLVGLVVNL